MAEELLHGGQADALPQHIRGERVAEHRRADVLGQSRPVGDQLDQSLGSPRPHGELVAEVEVVLQQGSDAAQHRHDAELGILAVGAAVAANPKLAPVREHVLGGQGAQLSDAEAGVEQDPDDDLLGRRLTGVGEAVGLLGGEGLAEALLA